MAQEHALLGKELPQQASVVRALGLFWAHATSGLASSPELAACPLLASHLLIAVCFGGFWETSLHLREIFGSEDL